MAAQREEIEIAGVRLTRPGRGKTASHARMPENIPTQPLPFVLGPECRSSWRDRVDRRSREGWPAPAPCFGLPDRSASRGAPMHPPDRH